MLDIEILKKKYGNQIVLENLHLQIDSPGIYGIIGKNGQGKTTLFNCALHLEDFQGHSLLQREKVCLQNTGYCPSEPHVYDQLTAIEFYQFYANLLNVTFQKGQELFPVDSTKLIKDLSTGTKKKVYLNAILQKKYKMYFLDEPFNGLDIESNWILMNALKHLAKDAIVVICSHILEVLYNNCDTIYMLKDKQLTSFSKEEYPLIEKVFFAQ